MRKCKLSKDELNYFYIDKNLSFKEIGNKVGLSKSGIQYLIYKYNIPSRILNKFIEKNLLQDLYVKKGLTLTEIGKELSCSRSNIFQYLKKYNIPTRKRGEHDVWNKGLTTEISEKLRNISLKKSISMTKLFKEDEVFRNKCFNNLKLANKIRGNIKGINKVELQLLTILQELFPNEYKFVGDAKFFIERFNPDFINCNGQKKIIELYGDYWHNLQGYIERDIKRQKIYFDYGYSTLIIWEKELKNTEILKNKLLEFHKVNR